MISLSTEEKIRILKIALESADLYNERVYKLHEYCYGLLNEITTGAASCKNMGDSVDELQDLIEGFKLKIYRYENYRAVVGQIRNWWH